MTKGIMSKNHIIPLKNLINFDIIARTFHGQIKVIIYISYETK